MSFFSSGVCVVSVVFGVSKMFIKLPTLGLGFSNMFGWLAGFSTSLVYTSCPAPTIPINSLMALRISSLESVLVSIVSLIFSSIVPR